MKKLSKKQKMIFGLLIVFMLIAVLIYVIVTVETSSTYPSFVW